MCVVTFMPVDRAMSYLGECECRTRNRKFKQEFPKIIGFAGYARAGKDTCADFVKEMFPEEYSRSSFANRLKYECSLMLSMVMDDFPDLRLTEDKIKYRDFLVFWGKYRRKMQTLMKFNGYGSREGLSFLFKDQMSDLLMRKKDKA